MDLTNVQNVAVIGAGVAGLSTAKLLISEGIDCTVFERNPVLGGVWADGYSNFGVQVQRELYEFPDWPLPKGVAQFTPGPVIQKYLEDYARHFDVWPKIKFSAAIQEIRKRSGDVAGWVVIFDEDGTEQKAEFDLVVVCNGLFSNRPHTPRFPGQDLFEGEIIHISQLRSQDQLRGKKVAVLGFGKSAMDAALESAAVAAKTTIIFREAHWPVPPKLLGVLPFKWAMLGRLTSTLLPPYYKPSGAEGVVHSVGKPLVWLWWRIVELMLIVQCKLWSRFGTRTSLVPTLPVEVGTFDESTMLPRPEFYRFARNGKIEPQRTEIAEFTASGVTLKNGASVDADVVVLATGWDTDYGFLSEEVRASLNFEDDGLYLYRQMVRPDVPNLVFVGYASTILSILTYNLQARWIGDLIKGRHQLPSREDVLRNIDDFRAWKRSWMPSSSARGARLLLHMLHYHDELLTDFGANPLRKTGVFAPFKEAFAPYQPSDYGAVVAGKPDGSD